MSEQVRPEGRSIARGSITALAVMMFAVGILVSAFTFTINGWTVIAAVGVFILWVLSVTEDS